MPGFALVRRIDPAALRDGPLSTIARSYLATLALLTPLSIACYGLHASVTVFSYGIVACVTASVLWLCFDRAWLRELGRPTTVGMAGALTIGADMVVGGRVGTNLGGDAGFHIARARMLLDHGFNNWDPLLAGHRFEAIYHTNIHHALLAAGAQLCNLHPGALWISAWPWAKLMSAAAAFHLAMAVFGQRPLAWAAAIGACIFVAPYSVLPYPNTLGPYWLMSMGIAFGVEALAAEPSYRVAAWLAAAAVVLAQMHMLFALFLALVVGPPLGVMALRALLRRLPGRRQLMAATLALGVSLPWLLTPAWPRIHAKLFPTPPPAAAPVVATAAPGASVSVPAAAPPVPATAAPAVSGWLAKQNRNFIQLPHGMVMGDPLRLYGARNRYTHLVVLLALGLFSVRRRRIAAIGAIVLSGCAMLFVPPLSTLLLNVAGESWILWRMTLVFIVIIFAVVPNTLLWLVQPFAKQRWLSFAWAWLAVIASAGYAWEFGVDASPWNRAGYWAQATRLTSAHRARAIAQTSRFFAKNVERGETIIAPLGEDYMVAMHCDCNVLVAAPDRGLRGLGRQEAAERRHAVNDIMRGILPPEERLAILRRYGVRTVFADSPEQAQRVTRGLNRYVTYTGRSRALRIIKFSLPRPS